MPGRPTKNYNHVPETVLMLIWKDGIPYFLYKQALGDYLNLYFGVASEDEAYTIPNTSYYLALVMFGSVWSADLTYQVEKGLEWGEDVQALAAELNAAVRAGREFDLTAYLNKFCALDPHFRYGLSCRQDQGGR